jgi:hypothetical protein
MSEDFDALAALVAIRRTHVAAAAAAIGVPGDAGDALFVHHAERLAGGCHYGTDATFDRLTIGVDLALSDTPGMLRTLEGAFRVPESTRRLAEALVLSTTEPTFRLEVTEHTDGSAPWVALDLPHYATVAAALGLLHSVGITDGAYVDAQARIEPLQVVKVTGVGLHLAAPDAAPAFSVRLMHFLPPAPLDEHVARLRRVWAAMGVSEAQQRWHGGICQAFLPQEDDLVPLTLYLTHEGLVPTLRATYEEVPADLVLRLLAHVVPTQGMGRKLGALAALRGDDRDVVSRLHLEAHPGEPPGIAFDLVARGAPTALL